MEISNFGLIISTGLVVTGWFVNSYFNRKQERLKKQIEYRLMTLQSFFPVVTSLTSSSQPFVDDKNLPSKIENARINFQLYGYSDELDLYNNFIEALEKQDINTAVENTNKLIKITRNRLRKELELPSLNI